MEKEKKQVEGKKKRHYVLEFWDFIRGQGVFGLAMGLVLGTATTKLVNSLIENIVMPPLGFLLGSSDGFRDLVLDLGTTPAGEQAVIRYGQFVSDTINFLVMALVVYFIVRLLKVEIRKK